MPGWLWVSGGLSLLVTVGLAFDVSPWLRGDLDWRWPYSPIVAPGRIAVASMLLALYIALATTLWRWANANPDELRRAWWIVGFAVVAGVVLQFAVQTISDPNPWRQLLLRTGHPTMGGYFDVAAFKTDSIGDLLRRFPQLAPGWDPHPQRHPPGLVTYFAALQYAFEQSPALTDSVVHSTQAFRCEYGPLLTISDAQYATVSGGLLSPIMNALTVIPLFAVGRHLLDRRAALAAVLISPLVPANLLWAGIWDQAFVLVTPILLWLLYLALVQRRHWTWWAAGGLLSLSSFFTHTTLPLLGFAGVFTLLFLWLEHEYWLMHQRQLLFNGLGFTLMASSVWLAYQLAFGVSFFDVYRANTVSHFDVTSHYFARLFYNPYDYLLFLGVVPGLLGFVALWQTRKQRPKLNKLAPSHIMILAYVITMIALVVSGISRGEVGRVWMFLMPLAILTAFAVNGGPSHSTGRWIATASLLAAQTIVMQAVLSVGPVFILERSFEMAESATPLGTQVGNAIELAGYEVDRQTSRPGDTLNVVLYWRSLRQPEGSYVAFSHVYQDELGFAGQWDSPPRGGDYPTVCWQPDEIIEDQIAIVISADAQAGSYELLIGMYSQPDVQRLPTIGPGAQDTAIVLTEIQVLP